MEPQITLELRIKIEDEDVIIEETLGPNCIEHLEEKLSKVEKVLKKEIEAWHQNYELDETRVREEDV